MMIEAARCLTHVRTRRSVLFLATTAEESGLLGADYFAHFPTVPRNDLVANINLDGTSALYPLRDVAGLGAEHSSLEGSFRKAAAALGLEVSPDPLPEEHFFRRADQYAFVLAGIPSIFVNEGLKSADPRLDGAAITKQWLETIYHSPKDDMNQPILYDWVVKQAQLNLLITYDVAQDSRRPAWKPGDFFAQPSRP
jgi:Zn-dependent M28 family amino/carboxypeptidase